MGCKLVTIPDRCYFIVQCKTFRALTSAFTCATNHSRKAINSEGKEVIIDNAVSVFRNKKGRTPIKVFAPVLYGGAVVT